MNTAHPGRIAAQYFAALVAGDIETVNGLLAEDAVWRQPGANRFSGLHRGRQAIGGMIAEMMRLSEGTFRLECTGAPMVNGERVAVPVRFQAEGKDKRMDMTGIDLLTIRNGKITAVELFSADGAAEDRFWGA